jgi:hypothetical protein
VEKREYVLKHLPEIEYRTCACDDRAAATLLEDELKANRDAYLFHERRRLVATRLRHGH